MNQRKISRRDLTTQAGAAGILQLAAAATVEAQQVSPSRPLHIVCVGAHPDDPESGCGGTLARYAAAGHQVTILYLTRGEAGIEGKTHEQAAAIRTAEAEAACKILGAKPAFAGQIDGDTEVNESRTKALTAPGARGEARPAPGPLAGRHPSRSPGSEPARHPRVPGRRPPVPALTSSRSTPGPRPWHSCRTPTLISLRSEKKKQAIFAHRSQDGEAIFREHHQMMEDFRGRALGVAAAEAFVSLARNKPRGGLPGLD